ncbi:galactose oxidase [Aaosphaeria arxii CBS 175.79]|uniref:Galactose oxidase n=1 Tax=Aaosphaeria arxii CBS 175.79 TaxID=1450172 RepID=A0A6A5XTN8_9PLEO|nr:galactose oxidase [Aaosphaeria arxii CBS 175.79]KAF2016279.1 galactose oxidase [Aaosphaeria arxii CBS 175.79]
MEAVAGALYAADNLLQGAAALATGILYPTLPLKSNISHITSVPIPISQHTISVVKGRAYIFGGENAPGQLANNDMHVVILPSSGVLEADYTTISPRAAVAGGAVPAARKGHTAVVIGDTIYVFGGEGVPEPENGRVWAFSTVANSWSYLDPSPGTLFPSQRTGHAAAGADFPGPRDVVFKERAPQQPADPAKAVPEPADDDSWGTLFVVGGKDVEKGELLNDALAFDIRTRMWSNVPSPPGQPREGASIDVVGKRLYRFGGKGVETFASGGMDFVDVSPVWKHAEGGTTPLTTGWDWEEIRVGEGDAPQARSSAGLVSVTTGQGRHYLLIIGGEGETSTFFDDIWSFQLPPEGYSAAAVKDQTRAAIKKDTYEGKWAELNYKFVDATGEETKEIPGQPKRGLGIRGHFAATKGTEVDGASVVAWGGVDKDGKVLGDGWLITVER